MNSLRELGEELVFVLGATIKAFAEADLLNVFEFFELTVEAVVKAKVIGSNQVFLELPDQGCSLGCTIHSPQLNNIAYERIGS